MHRRAVLKSVFSTFAGAGLLRPRCLGASKRNANSHLEDQGPANVVPYHQRWHRLVLQRLGRWQPARFSCALGAALRLVGIPNGFLIRARAALHCL